MYVPSFETNLPGQRDAQAQFAAIFRMKVAAIVSAVNPAGGKVLKCNRWDGVNTGVRIYMVEPLFSHAVGDDIYACLVAGKTASTYTGSTTAVTRHVVWKETIGNGGLRPCTCVASASNVTANYGDASNRATVKYDITEINGSGTVGASLNPKGTPGRVVANKVAAGTFGAFYFNGTVAVLLQVVDEYALAQENCT